MTDAVNACRDGDVSGSRRGKRGRPTQSMGLLLITNRASMLQIADMIIVLKDGKIVEEGTYAELRRE